MLSGVLRAIFRFFCAPNSQGPDKPEQQQPAPHQQHYYPPSAVVLPPKKHHQDPNQVNQSNDYYTSLRAQANEHGDQMAKCFQQSHEVYNRGDGALAKQLSNQGKEHQRKMEDFNREASDWIFRENNKDSAPGEIDLHGLYVKEAITRADEAISQAKREGKSDLRLIVGKGLHSKGGAAKIKPAIEDLMQKHRLKAELDPQNSGVLVIEIDASSRQRGLGADEISRRLERDDEACIIM